MLFPRLFRQAVARTPDRVALANLANDVEFTYTELADRSYAVANALQARGIGKGDKVAICVGNRAENVFTYLATQFIGAVAVPFNFRVPSGGIRYHIEDAEPDLFVFDAFSRDAVVSTADDLNVGMVYIGDDDPAFADPFETLLDAATDEPEIAVDGEDLSLILYSSGTTGDPKGIPITHENTTGRIVTNSLGQSYRFGVTMPGAMPLYHTVGLHCVLGSVYGLSGTLLIMPEFDPERYAKAIEEYDVNALHEAPTIFRAVLNSEAIDDVDVSSVEKVGFSGAPMSTDLFERLMDTFDPDHFANLYGTTEALGTLGYIDLHDIRQPSVVGPANFFLETRIVELGSSDPAATVEPGTEGELIVNTDSPVCFDGYYNKPEQTAAAIHDGWFFTGDAVYERDDGNFVITGRADDVIISGGENIHPVNVEDVLASHPDVADVGVIGVPDEEWGEIVFAFVQAADGLSEHELDEWYRDNEAMPDFTRPRGYEFVEEIPRNPSGKVMRYKLRERV